MKENKLKELNATKEAYKQAKNDIKVTIRSQMSDWKEIKSFMEELSYELWKELN